MAKTVTLRIDDRVYRLFSQRAKAERRSLSNYIEVAAFEHSQEMEFVDDLEMEGIFANKKLVEHLREGSREARIRKGRFVA